MVLRKDQLHWEQKFSEITIYTQLKQQCAIPTMPNKAQKVPGKLGKAMIKILSVFVQKIFLNKHLRIK